METLMLVMVLIWFLNGLFSLFSNWFGVKPIINVLSCGLTGYSGSKPADPAKIKMIMMYNEERGEDSTGWAINDQVVKDTDKVTKFITKNKLVLSSKDENFTIIAHARKTSSGARYDKELAHPFGIYNGDNKDKFDLILAMNGTLSNTDLIAKEFKEEYKANTNSDTQILSRIISRLGPNDYREALKLYDGNATLLFYFPQNPNTLLVYKDPDRPLFCWNQNENQIYISSLREPLLAIGADDKDICYFEANHLYYIDKGVITNKENITRTPKKHVATFPKRAACGVDYAYGHTGRYEHYDFETGVVEKSSLLSSKPNDQKLMKRSDNKSLHSGRGNKIYTINERYFRNGHPLQGKYFIGNTGKLTDQQKASLWTPEDKGKPEYSRAYYFINGHMCKTELDYNSIVSKCKDIHGNFDLEQFKQIRISEFVENFEYPVVTICDKKEVWIVSDEYLEALVRKGDKVVITPFLSDEEFTIVRTDKWTTTSNKLACEVGEVKSANNLFSESIADVTSEENESETEEFLIGKLKTEASISPNFYYCAVRKDFWRKNISQELKEYFFNFLFNLSLKYQVISESSLIDLKLQATTTEYSGKEFTKNLESIIQNLKKKVMTAKVDTLSTTLEELSTEDKITLHSNNPGVFSEEDIINSIKIVNPFLRGNGFDTDIYNAETEIEIIENNWIKNQKLEGEVRSFCEASLICLAEVQVITSNELLYILEEDLEIIKSKTHIQYKKWHAIVNKKTNEQKSNDDKTPDENGKEEDCENDIENSILDTESLSDENNTPEKLTPEYYYDEFQSEVNEIFNNMGELKFRMKNLEEQSKNSNFLKLEVKFSDLITYSVKHLVKK